MAKLTSCRGKTAVVTGASSGIGRALAARLAREGASVGLVARRRDLLDHVAEEIRGLGGRAVVLPSDVGDRQQVFDCAQRATAELGSVDILVNSAGYGHHRRFLEWDLDDIERVMRVNYFGALYWTKALLPQMVERRQGWVVFIASVAGKIGVPDESAYAASKFAMVGLAEALSIEVEDAGVHILTVCPGTIDTPFFDEEAKRRMPAVARRLMIEPERVVDATMTALARGKHDITVPWFIAAGYIARAIAPGFMRRSTKKTVAGGSWLVGGHPAPATVSVDRPLSAPYKEAVLSMQKGTASGLTVIRVARGAPAPAAAVVKAAIEADRARQHLAQQTYFDDHTVAGPYPVTVDGKELDEYVVWER